MLSLLVQKKYSLIACYNDGIESFGSFLNEDAALSAAESYIQRMPENFSHFEIKTIIVPRRREDNGKE